MHVSTARESEMCYSLGTSVGDVTRLNVANVVRFSLYTGALRTHGADQKDLKRMKKSSRFAK